MNNLYDSIGLTVKGYNSVDDEYSHQFKRIFTDNDIPVYFPVDYLYLEDYDYSTLRCLVIPIVKDDFMKGVDSGITYTGYFYSFSNCIIHTPIAADPQYRHLSASHTQMSSTVDKFGYTPLSDNSIIIDNKLVQAAPEYIDNNDGPTANVGYDVLEMIKKRVNEFNRYFYIIN